MLLTSRKVLRFACTSRKIQDFNYFLNFLLIKNPILECLKCTANTSEHSSTANPGIGSMFLLAVNQSMKSFQVDFAKNIHICLTPKYFLSVKGMLTHGLKRTQKQKIKTYLSNTLNT